MSEFADALGLSDRIRHAAWKRDREGKPVLGDDGKPLREPARDYQLAAPDTLEVMGRWEQYLEHEAWHALQRRYPGPENAALLQAKEMELNVSIVAGDYSYFSSAAMQAMSRVMSPHWRKFIFFCLCPYVPEREAEFISEEFAKEQRAELYRLQRQAAGVVDPKGPAPTGASLSGANGSQPSSPSLLTPESPIPLSGVS